MKNLKKSHFTKILSLVLALIFIVGTFAGCGGETEPETTEAPSTEATTEAEVVRNPLTGDTNYSKKLLKSRPVLITVENHPDARPQWGLTSSDIVWETVAEGGITRMLLMYANAERVPEKVGPIRSARPYFVDIAEGFDAIFVHFGYSPQAKTQLENHGVNNVNGLIDGSYFTRDKSRNVSSEHTSYTTGEDVTKAIADKEYRTTIESDYKKPFKFNNETKTFADECLDLTVSFSSGYTYQYTYDKEDKVYYSALNGTPFVDSEGTQQNFENIIVCYTDISTIDSKGRLKIDLSEGGGIYASNGSYTEITWKKGDSADMMKFYDKDGNELSINTGRTYIAILDNSRESYNKIG